MALQEIDPFFWIYLNKIQLPSAQYSIKNHEYQIAPLQCKSPVQVFKKGAQLGMTELCVLKTLHGLIHSKYPQGAMYLFPTGDDVSDFSRARFNPIINRNPCIGMHVRETDSTQIKSIGQGFLYLRGARETGKIEGAKGSSTKLKSAPVDLLVFDERDEMKDSMVRLAYERVSHSEMKHVISLSTPTIPEYGIEALYDTSDQRLWMIECPACYKETCLEAEFPDCLRRRKDGTAYRACIHCGHELHPQDGHWVSSYPDRDVVGWWISQLNSMYIDPTEILNLYEEPPGGDLSEVMNSKLARGYIPLENKLTRNQVYSCCSSDDMPLTHPGPACMGVDVGSGTGLHVVIGIRPSARTLKLIKIGCVPDFNAVHDLAKQYGVRIAVVDKYPETFKARDFQREEPYRVFLCGYQDAKKRGPTAWNDAAKEIMGNRTEIFDMSHNAVTDAGKLELPRPQEVVHAYARQMCNVAKVLEEDKETGAKYYRYRKIGDDHYRNATNYCLLAAQRCGLTSDFGVVKSWFKRRRRQTAMTA